jgi:hypothetical protein
MLNKCTGYCGGGCNSCSGDGQTCNDCNKGYTLIDGKCWPCPTGCNKCIPGQRDMFYRGWGTSCVDAFQPIPTPTPTPTPTPEPTPTPINNNNNYNNNNVQTPKDSNTGETPVKIFIICGLVSIAIAAFFVIKRNSKSQHTKVQQDYARAMAAEKQRQAALNVPASNYQYQPPQAYPQGYYQGSPQQPTQL